MVQVHPVNVSTVVILQEKIQIHTVLFQFVGGHSSQYLDIVQTPEIVDLLS
jgi:hypothetical protein